MWAFEVTPATLPEIYWSHTFEDIRNYARLRLSWFQTQAGQHYQIMRIIVEQAFGSSKGGEQDVPQSKEEAQGMLQNIFKARQ